MADQSTLQKFVQQAQGTHTAGQLNVPTSAGTGNPNGVYNWSSYGVTPGVNGAAPTFNLQSQQVPASDPNYQPPFAADPYLAGVLSGMPQAQGNDHVDRILGRLFSGGGNWGGTGPGTGAPGTGNPTNPGPGTPGPGTTGPGTGTPVHNPVGPISGPIGQNPHNWQWNFENAQPNTSPNDPGALGRTPALDWLRLNQDFQGNSPGWNGVMGKPIGGTESDLDPETGGFWSRVGDIAGGLLGNLGSALSADWQEFKGDITGQNGGRGILRQIFNAIVPGLGNLIPEGRLTASQRAEFENTINQQLQGAIANMSAEQRQQLTQNADAMLDGFIRDAGAQAAIEAMAGDISRTRNVSYEESLRLAQQMYDSAPEMTPAEWRRTQESMDWNNFWNSRGQGTTRNPVTGLPSQDLIDDMINQMAARAVNWTNEQIARRGHLER